MIMNITPQLDRVFPLSGGSSERPALRAPRLGSLVRPSSGLVMGNRAFMRAWAARRAATRATADAMASPLQHQNAGMI
jgi:hypothetical protein